MFSSAISSFNSEPLLEEADLVVALDAMQDLRCNVDIVIGTATLRWRESLRLSADSIVRLHQSTGRDLELRVNGVTVATGEIVITESATGLPVSHVASLRA